jgi:7,8-dihydro-6-hydroxymethylpterin-pyrophosphokinase
MSRKWQIENKDRYNEYQRQFYANNKEEQTQRIYANRAKRREKLKELIKDIKNTPCADCNIIYHPEAMDFDHIGDKEFNVANAVRDATSADRLLKEVEKCEVVCSNCHRVRTAKRAGRI